MSVEILQVHLPSVTEPLTRIRERKLCEAITLLCPHLEFDIQVVHQKMADGQWLAVAVPQLCSAEMLHINQPETTELWAMFPDCQLYLLALHQPFHDRSGKPFERLNPLHQLLLRLLYLGQQQVQIIDEIGGGFSGARTLIVAPIMWDGRAQARQLVKLAWGADIKSEQKNYIEYVQKEVPQIIPQCNDYIEYQQYAALSYSFLDGGILGQIKTLEEYIQQEEVSSEQIIESLKQLFEHELSNQWYRQSQPYHCHFMAEYGQDLVEHLRLDIHAPTDGCWQSGSEPTLPTGNQSVDSVQLQTNYEQFNCGATVQLEGLKIRNIKSDEVALHDPAQPGLVVKMTYQKSLDADIEEGDRVVVRGAVRYNRQARLEAIVHEAFQADPNFELHVEDVNARILPWQHNNKIYPNPLRHYRTLLSNRLQSRKSRVHGDMHLRNILVDKNGRPYLIDFALVTVRHNLYDFIKLETFVRQMYLNKSTSRFSFAEYLQFEEALAIGTLGHHSSSLAYPDLARATEIITAIRRNAERCMGGMANWLEEYFPSLCLYNLAVLKYHKPDDLQASRLAFGTAAVNLWFSQSNGGDPAPAGVVKGGNQIDEELADAFLGVHDMYTRYEIGIHALMKQIDSQHPKYQAIAAQKLLLDENLREVRTFFDTADLKHRRIQILAKVDALALDILGIPFDDLCNSQ